ncbi:MAG: MFS transporter [Proteobacteria bacterium]|nr:MFS transporter [Pseudomonadota bacterium]
MKGNTHYRSPWFALFVLLTASVAAPLNQFKVPPVLPLLMDAFSLSVGRAGLLMSVFALTGLILALPVGFVFQKLGYRITGLLAVGSVIVGASMGAVSTGTGTMLISRVIEGLGMSFMTVVAPAVIATWFAADERGTPMGIWATWVPLGSTVTFVVAPLLVARWNWQAVWWFGCLFAAVGWLLYYFFIKTAPIQFAGTDSLARPKRLMGNDLVRVLRNRDLWLISLLFCCFNLAFIAFVTWTPTFFNAIRGVSLARASLFMSFLTMFSLVSLPISGWISDRAGSRKLVCVTPMILLMILWPVTFFVGEGGFLPLVIAMGLVGGFVPTGVFSAGVEAVGDERLAGMAMAVIQVGQNAGMLMGPLAFGGIVEAAGGWQIAFWMLVPVCAVGAMAGWMARMR